MGGKVRNPKCRNPKSEIRDHKSLVSLGDKFALAAGLMEITYDTGAKVILQGPVTYEVESAAGGFLSVGKLTAKLEKKAEGSNPPCLILNSSLSTIHYPLFTIKTPTTTVTDLGTEFGVEVSKDGRTNTRVFVGEVVATAVARPGQSSRSVRLRAGEAARIDGENSVITVLTLPADEKRFTRVMPRPKAHPVVLVDDDTTRPAYRYGWRDGVYSGFGWDGGWRLRPGTADMYFVAASGSIDADGKSVGTSADRNGSAEAIRDFAFDDLPVGATFMIDFQNGRIGSGCSTGFGLHNARGEYRFQFFAIAGRATYGVWDAAGRQQDTDIPYTEKGLHIELTRTGPDAYDLKVVRLESNTTYAFSGAFVDMPGGKDVKRFRHWHWDDSSDTPYRTYLQPDSRDCSAEGRGQKLDLNKNDIAVGVSVPLPPRREKREKGGERCGHHEKCRRASRIDNARRHTADRRSVGNLF